MKTLRRLAVIVPLVLVAEMSLLGAQETFAQKLRVAYTAFAGTFTILWVGHDAGLYRKAGVDLELLYIGSSTKAVQALLGGDIDIVYSAAGSVVDANAAGADLVIIGCQYDQGRLRSSRPQPSPTSAGSRQGSWGDRFGSFSDFVARHVLRKISSSP
jgi:ABC-type nitrate/sulfonate/bicarbonate transport system substrate-binding protein